MSEKYAVDPDLANVVMNNDCHNPQVVCECRTPGIAEEITLKLNQFDRMVEALKGVASMLPEGRPITWCDEDIVGVNDGKIRGNRLRACIVISQQALSDAKEK